MYFRLIPVAGEFSEEDVIALRDWADEYVRKPMARVPGVSSVRLWGGSERQVQIYVDPVKLAERNIRLLDVRNAIRAHRDVSGGDLDSGKRRYVLRTIGRFQTVAELDDLIIAERDGVFVRLRDAAGTQRRRCGVRHRGGGSGTTQSRHRHDAGQQYRRRREYLPPSQLGQTALKSRAGRRDRSLARGARLDSDHRLRVPARGVYPEKLDSCTPTSPFPLRF